MVEESNDRVFVVGNGVVVITDATDTAETIIDAKSGDIERYDEASNDMATLVDALGSASSPRGGTMDEPDDPDPERGQFENMVARGSTTEINGATSNGTWVVVYERADDVDTDDLATWTEANDGTNERFDDIEDISYSSDGRLGFITGTIDTDEV